ncbi:Heavy metal transport/detoxification superfamily protein [Perilla frutescens var. hirtella]|nr:Heavy metal transport/detoxification superfamily protein [Perilla frutescens var. frutescens]KAH6787783.1 Heavy metal transport/detoxification superfamily protein [Perilla frutescens var. hirtella]
MGEKVTVMVLKVDLQCPCCYKKVKKILCKFPQIRDQIYNEKANTVTITVVCCDPEKVRDKLCCKGAKVIKSIEIVEPPKPKPPEKPKEPEKPKQPEKPKEPEKTNIIVIPEPNKPEKPKLTFVEPPKPKDPEKPKEKPPAPPPKKPKEPPKPDPPKAPPPTPAPAPAPAPTPPPPVPVPPTCGYPPVFPARTCCGPCSEGYGGGPCYYGFGVAPPPPPQPCFEGYYGYGYHERPCHVTRCDYYFSEENPQSCSIM